MSRFAPRASGRTAAARTIARTAKTKTATAKTAALLAAAVTAFAITSAATLAVAPAVQAKPYKVYACATPSGKPIWLNNGNVDHWHQWYLGSQQSFSTASEDCGQGAPIELRMATPGNPGASYQLGRLAMLSIYLPVPVSRVEVRRSVRTTQGDDRSASPEYRADAISPSGRDPLEVCTEAYGCKWGDPRKGNGPENVADWRLPRNTWNLEMYVQCSGAHQGTCALNDRTRLTAEFYRFAFDVDDANSPEKVDVSGTLTEPGVLSGSKSLDMSAIDRQSGLYELLATVDGQEIMRVRPDHHGTCARYDEADVPDYGGSWYPCPRDEVVKRRFDFDTTKLSDGKHALKVEATDAAGNTTVLAERTLEIDNVPAPTNLTLPGVVVTKGQADDLRVGDSLTAANGAWSGAGLSYGYQWQRSTDGVIWGPIGDETKSTYVVKNADVGSYLRVRVTVANREGTATAESAQTAKVKDGVVGPSGKDAPPSEGDDRDPQLVVDREQRTVEVGYGAKIVVTGRLVDADGQPIANASVDVFEQLVVTAAPWTKIDRVVTDSQGGYVFRPTTTASRRLRFAFADERDSAKYRATREVLVSVRAGMTIKAKRHVVSPRGTIRLRGHVTVDQLPKTGTWVEIQVLDAGVWRTIATRRTSSKGLWTFKHRLRQSSGITFKFRSRLRVIADVASAEAKSLPVKVRIR